jgi:hypothetical protein
MHRFEILLLNASLRFGHRFVICDPDLSHLTALFVLFTVLQVVPSWRTLKTSRFEGLARVITDCNNIPEES